MTCACIEQINEALADTNTMLDVPIVLNLETGEYRSPMIRIAVSKRDSRNREKARPVMPTYCPFCGVRYRLEASDAKT